MDCPDIQRALRAREVLGTTAQSHLLGCLACAELARAAPRMPVPAPAVADRRDRLLWDATAAELARDVGPAAWLRERSTGVRLGLALLLASLVPLVVVLLRPRVDLHSYPAARMGIELGALLLAACVGVWATLRPMQLAARPILRVLAIGLPLLAAMMIASMPVSHDEAPPISDPRVFVAQALGCLAFGTLCAVPTWLALRLLAREGAALGRRAHVLAAAAFVVGVAAVFLHCPQLHAGHLWLGHVGIAIPLLAWAWWNARRSL